MMRPSAAQRFSPADGPLIGPARSMSRPWSRAYALAATSSARRSSGPSLSIVTFGDEDEAVRIANDTEYGLVATRTPKTWRAASG